MQCDASGGTAVAGPGKADGDHTVMNADEFDASAVGAGEVSDWAVEELLSRSEKGGVIVTIIVVARGSPPVGVFEGSVDRGTHAGAVGVPAAAGAEAGDDGGRFHCDVGEGAVTEQCVDRQRCCGDRPGERQDTGGRDPAQPVGVTGAALGVKGNHGATRQATW